MRSLAGQPPGRALGELPDMQIIFRIEHGLRRRLERLDLDIGIGRRCRERLHVALRERRKIPERRRHYSSETRSQLAETFFEELVERSIGAR